MRQLREHSGLSLREVARRLGFSAAYLSDLERGQRLWNKEREQQYKRALKEPMRPY